MAESTLLLFCLNPPLKPSQVSTISADQSKNPKMASEEPEQKRMQSPRPVPRRESPWGRPEGDTREPKAHRCNDRAEDVIYACFEGNPFQTVPGPFKLFWKCMFSKPGEEPTEPFFYLDLDPPKREEARLD